MTIICKIITAAALTAFATTAQAGWTEVNTRIDPMNDAKIVSTFIQAEKHDKSFMSHAVDAIGIRCESKKLTVIALTDGFISTNGGTLQYSAGTAEAKTIKTNVSTTGKAYMFSGKAAASFLKDALSTDSMKIIGYDFRGTGKLSTVEGMNANIENVKIVAEACNVKL